LWHRGSLRRFCSICCRVFIGRLTSEIEEHNAALAVPGVDCVVGAVHCAHVWLARWRLVEPAAAQPAMLRAIDTAADAAVGSDTTARVI